MRLSEAAHDHNDTLACLRSSKQVSARQSLCMTVHGKLIQSQYRAPVSPLFSGSFLGLLFSACQIRAR